MWRWTVQDKMLGHLPLVAESVSHLAEDHAGAEMSFGDMLVYVTSRFWSPLQSERHGHQALCRVARAQALHHQFVHDLGRLDLG
jgi:hypothetical protein